MELRKYVGNKIKEIRLRNSMNQEQLAEILNTTKQSVSRYETGERKADQDILFKLSEKLNVSINYFFPEIKKPEYQTSEYTYYPTAISAGLPLDVEAITKADKISIPQPLMGKWAGNKDIYITRVSGDSMNKVMRDGSLIAVRPVSLENLKDGDIVVYSKDGEYAVKRYFNFGDEIEFRPDSYDKNFRVDTIDLENDIELKIKGKVVLYIIESD